MLSEGSSTIPVDASPGGVRKPRTRALHSRVIVRLVWSLALLASLALIGHALLTPSFSAPAQAEHAAAGTPLPPAGDVGHLAPNVTLIDLSGRPVTIASFQGRVLVLNFWYIACEPCRFEMPIFERVYHANQGRQLVVVGVNVADDAGSIGAFTHALGLDYPVVRDASQQAVGRYGVSVTPTTFVVDQHGVIRAKFAGAITDSQQLNQVIKPLLASS